MNTKISFLIDGFNLYNSIKSLKKKTGYQAKWLDIHSLCKSYLHLFGKQTTLEKVFFFSAIPWYLNNKFPDKIDRHRLYMKCLKSTGIEIVNGRFKSKDVYCPSCQSMILKHEEKETDVAIAIKIFELCHTNQADIITIVSGDTDLAPAVRTCQKLFPEKEFIFIFPFARKNKELLKLAPDSFSISKKQYATNLFSNPLKINGKTIYKPKSW